MKTFQNIFAVWMFFLSLCFVQLFSLPLQAFAQDITYSPIQKLADLPLEKGYPSYQQEHLYEFQIAEYGEKLHILRFYKNEITSFEWDGKTFTSRRKSRWHRAYLICSVGHENHYYLFGWKADLFSAFLDWFGENILDKVFGVKWEGKQVFVRYVEAYLYDLKKLRLFRLPRVDLGEQEKPYYEVPSESCGVFPDGSPFFLPTNPKISKNRGFRWDASSKKWRSIPYPKGVLFIYSPFVRATDGFYYAVVGKAHPEHPDERRAVLAQFRLAEDSFVATDWEVPYTVIPYTLIPRIWVTGSGEFIQPFGITAPLFGTFWKANFKETTPYYLDAVDFYKPQREFGLPATKQPRAVIAKGEKVYFVMKGALWEYDLKKAPWERLKEMSFPRAYPAVAISGDTMLVAGGEVNGTPDASAEAISTSSGESTVLPKMREARAGAAAVLWNGNPIVIGGADDFPLSTAERFNIQLRRWEIFPSMKVARAFPAGVVFQNKIWIFGGFNQEGVLNSYETYTAKSGWQMGGKIPLALYQATATATGDGIILAGGITADGSVSAQVYQLNPATGEWKELPSMTSPRSAFCLQSLADGSLLALFGWNGEKISPTYEVLKSGAEKWEEYKYTVYPRYGSNCASLSGRIFFAGGIVQTLGPSALVDSFHPLPVYPPP